jgi:putative two-component system response regulator
LNDEEFSFIKFHPDDGGHIFEPLSQEEVKAYEAHTLIGSDIVGEEETPLLKMAGIIAKTHHEKWDGTGYPNGLKGNEIPLAGRIVALADIFDALSTKRHYKPAFPIEKCKEIIKDLSGNHLDPKLTDLFLKNINLFIEIKNKFDEK